jgi:hypothetical protein
MGRSKNYNTAAPETRHKQTKRKLHETNNHCTVGRSLLLNNMDVEVEQHLLFLQDKRGTFIYITFAVKIYQVCTKNIEF